VAHRALARGREKGLDGNELAAMVEAECLREAIRRNRADVQPITADATAPRTGNNLASAVAFLERVATLLPSPEPHTSTDRDNLPI
jgi:hypothetical protein